MRLLDTETGQFVDYPDEGKVPAYAILSHTWDPQGEQTYHELRAARASPLASVLIPFATTSLQATATSLPAFSDDPAVSEKVRMACVTARLHGHHYIWIDSCCIDKASSTELSEAINSMYRWYGKATVCYAFLADVSPDDNAHDNDAHDTASQIRRSRWFTRGWTLQELIAPRHVVFLSQEWHVLGSKSSLAPLLEEVTGIERAVLTHAKQLDAVSVAARMSWASGRSTTRVEDEAYYSLLGIFDINMPTLYGEGRRAFARLQEEIVRQIPDQSLFAWGNIYLYSPPTPLPNNHPSNIYASKLIEFVFELDGNAQSLFAPSPLYFKHAGSIRAVPLEVANKCLGRSITGHYDNALPIPSYSVSPYGMRTDLLLLDVEFFPFHGSVKVRTTVGRWLLAILTCQHAKRDEELLARVCYVGPSTSQTQPLVGGLVSRRVPPPPQALDLGETESRVQYSVVSLPLRYLESRLRTRTCYIPYLRLGHPEIRPQRSLRRRWTTRCMLPEWQKAVLQSQGYAVTTGTTAPITPSGTNRHHLTLSNSNHTITIEYQYRLVLDSHGLDDEVAGSGPDLGAYSDYLRSNQLTVWLDAVVIPSSTSPRALDSSTVGQEMSGPHEWLDFCAQRFEFPEATIKTSESSQMGVGGGTSTLPSALKVTQTIRFKVAIEPIAEADTDTCSHHILVELVEDEQVEAVVADLQTGTDSGSSVKDEKRGGSWAEKLGRRFKSQTRLR